MLDKHLFYSLPLRSLQYLWSALSRLKSPRKFRSQVSFAHSWSVYVYLDLLRSLAFYILGRYNIFYSFQLACLFLQLVDFSLLQGMIINFSKFIPGFCHEMRLIYRSTKNIHFCAHKNLISLKRQDIYFRPGTSLLVKFCPFKLTRWKISPLPWLQPVSPRPTRTWRGSRRSGRTGR